MSRVSSRITGRRVIRRNMLRELTEMTGGRTGAWHGFGKDRDDMQAAPENARGPLDRLPVPYQQAAVKVRPWLSRYRH